MVIHDFLMKTQMFHFDWNVSFPGSLKTGTRFSQPRVHTIMDRTSACRVWVLLITMNEWLGDTVLVFQLLGRGIQCNSWKTKNSWWYTTAGRFFVLSEIYFSGKIWVFMSIILIIDVFLMPTFYYSGIRWRHCRAGHLKWG